MHDPKPTAHGVAVWSTPEWRAEAEVWLDEQLAAERHRAHRRGWSNRGSPVGDGAEGADESGRGLDEGGCARDGVRGRTVRAPGATVPDRVLIPIAADVTRGWLLLPDGGEPIAARLDGTDLTDAFADAMAQYGQLQRDLAPHVGELLALGVTDMRPAVMPERLETALAVTASVARMRAADQERHEQARRCGRRSRRGAPSSPRHRYRRASTTTTSTPTTSSATGPAEARFYDSGDSVVAHPFAVMLVALNFLKHLLDCERDDPRVRQAAIPSSTASGRPRPTRISARPSSRVPGRQGRPCPRLGPGPAGRARAR